jgi:acetolactate synthase-1/2/3 large subunit
MTLAELETLVRLDLPVTVVVFDDAALSLIEVKQSPRGQGGTNAVRYRPIDFSALAASMGVPSRRVASRDQLSRAVVESQSGGGPFLIDVEIDPSGYRAVLSAIRGGSRE